MASKVSVSFLLCVGVLFGHRALAQPTASEPESTQPAAEPTPLAVDVDAARRAEAETRRQQALIFYDSGDYLAARREFERANQLMPSFRLLYNLGVVSMALADAVSAYDYFERYLAEGGADIAPGTRAELEPQLRALAKQIAVVVVVVDTPGAAVFVDDTWVGVAPLAGPLHLNPGTRRISARLPGARGVSRILNLTRGEAGQVELKLAPPHRVVIQAPARQNHVLEAGWVTTTALTAGAVVAGLEALSAQHRYQDTFGSIGASRAELDDLDARTTRWSVAADTLSGAAIIVGAYSLYVTLRHAPPVPSATSATKNFSVHLLSDRASLGVNF